MSNRQTRPKKNSKRKDKPKRASKQENRIIKPPPFYEEELVLMRHIRRDKTHTQVPPLDVFSGFLVGVLVQLEMNNGVKAIEVLWFF